MAAIFLQVKLPESLLLKISETLGAVTITGDQVNILLSVSNNKYGAQTGFYDEPLLLRFGTKS